MISHDTPARLVDLPGCYNLRDTGGYQAHGGTTRWRTLLRSASPFLFPEEGMHALHEMGVHAMIDLRRPSEAEGESYHAALREGVRYHALPLFDDHAYQVVDVPANDLDQLYQLILEHCGPQFSRVLHTIAAEEGPLLVHCAIGKDRTGLVVALTLGAIGVDAQTISDDYALSFEQLQPLFEQFRSNERARGGDMERLERFLASRRETMLEVLAYLEQHHGGIEGYLATHGVDSTVIERLRAKLVTA
ncbi:MAG: tyrosine-protein phosphatase [Roseiflexaceae bacterium]|nr:tyrosine-protein phosphatase [Roseiflexaceae bacterium]